jgi:hypothetical protein
LGYELHQQKLFPLGNHPIQPIAVKAKCRV